MITPPDGWTVEYLYATSARLRNDEHGVTVTISPRYRPSSWQKSSTTERVQSYRVSVGQDWFSKGVYGDRKMAAKAPTWAAAVDVAEEFMNEFVVDRATQPVEAVHATHRETGDLEQAEELLTADAAVEAFVDTTGYTDDLLLDALEPVTGGDLLAVAHRDGEDVEVVSGADSPVLDRVSLETLYSAFPVDRTEVKETLENDSTVSIAIRLGDYRVHRFVVAEERETDVVVDRWTPIKSPTFETTVWNVLEAKWPTVEGVSP